MEKIINEWTASKHAPDFNYEDALKTLIEDKRLDNQSIDNYLHFDFSNEEIREHFEAVHIIDLNDIKYILHFINKYTYYLLMNDLLKSYQDKNIKKLEKLNKLWDDDFIEFLDRYLNLDTTINTSGLKLGGNYSGITKSYLQLNFKYAVNQLEKFLCSKSQRHDSLSIKNNEFSNSILLKPKSTSYLKPLSHRAIMKALHFELLYNIKNLTKMESLLIIEYFFAEKLHETKTEHSFRADTIKFIKKEDDDIFDSVEEYYTIELDKNKKIIPPYIKELKQILDIKKAIKDNFDPIYTISGN